MLVNEHRIRSLEGLNTPVTKKYVLTIESMTGHVLSPHTKRTASLHSTSEGSIVAHSRRAPDMLAEYADIPKGETAV